MRYYGVTKIILPWFDTDGMKQRSVLTFSDPTGAGVSRRRIWREITKFALRNFKKRVCKAWVQSQQILNSYDISKATKIHSTEVDIAIEAWIKRMEHNETEDGADTTSQGVDAQGTNGEMLPVQTIAT